MSNIKDNLLQLIGKTPLVRLSNIYKDEYGTEIIAKVGSMIVPPFFNFPEVSAASIIA